MTKAFSRRDMLKLGLAGTGYFILGPDGRVSFAASDSLPASPYTEPFIDELPLPGSARRLDDPFPPFPDLPQELFSRWVDESTDFVTIASEVRWVKFHSQLPLTAIWGYRDLSPDARPSIGAGSREPLPYSVFGPTLIQLFGELAPRTPYLNGAASLQVTPAYPVGGGLCVRHINALPSDHRGFGVPRTTIHLHGGHHLSRSDGFPGNIEFRPGNPARPDYPYPAISDDPAISDGFPAFVVQEPPGFVPPPDEEAGDGVTPRQVYDYYYPILDPGVVDTRDGNTQSGPPEPDRPSTQWYHDHLLDFTGPNVYRGLAGFVLCFDELDSNDENDPGPKALHLPSGRYDIPLALQDKRFGADGSLVYKAFDHDGFLGDKFVVNGAIQPFLNVRPRKYRFRFLNGSNARIYQLFFNDGKRRGRTYPMDMIATEGGLLSRPLRGAISFQLSMAERVEMVIDFSPFAPGTELFIENRLPQTNGRKPEKKVVAQGSGNQMIKFIVGDPLEPGEVDPSEVRDVLRPFAEVSAADKAQAFRRKFSFGRSHGAWTINDKLAGELEKPIAYPRRGRPEIWTLENTSGGWWHPIHIHSEFFKVLSRNGRVPTDTARNPVVAEKDGLARRDTILLRGNETVEVFLRFRDFLGPFTFHCHNIEHEDMAMMARFDVIP